MDKLKIKSVAFENADSSIFYNGKIELFKLIDENKKILTYFNNFIDSKKTIFDSGRIYSLLLDAINQYHFSAISVECFSLVKNTKLVVFQC